MADKENSSGKKQMKIVTKYFTMNQKVLMKQLSKSSRKGWQDKNELQYELSGLGENVRESQRGKQK